MPKTNKQNSTDNFKINFSFLLYNTKPQATELMETIGLPLKKHP